MTIIKFTLLFYLLALFALIAIIEKEYKKMKDNSHLRVVDEIFKELKNNSNVGKAKDDVKRLVESLIDENKTLRELADSSMYD